MGGGGGGGGGISRGKGIPLGEKGPSLQGQSDRETFMMFQLHLLN